MYPFPTAGFDVVVSRAGAMFFGDPAAAFANLACATRPGGRLVLLVWQAFERNPWIVSGSTTPEKMHARITAPSRGATGDAGAAELHVTRALLAALRVIWRLLAGRGADDPPSTPDSNDFAQPLEPAAA